MAVTVYKSSDTSAPALSGTTGSLISVLDACLVNGYGSKSAAGWSKAFSGTNRAAYQQGAASGADCYLDVNDAAAGTGGAKEANVRGYETMSAVGTGTGDFPATAQVASPGLFVRKSATADSTSRGWLLLADDKTFHLFVLSGDSANQYEMFSFGEIYSMKSADAYRVAIIAHTATGGSSVTGLDTNVLADTSTSVTPGLYVPRIAAGTGTSVNPGLFGLGRSLVTGPFTGPNAADGLMYVSRLFVSDNATAANGLRGYLRGVWQLVTGRTGVSDGDTFSGTGDLSGRSFLVLRGTVASSVETLALETSAWDTSS